MQCLYSKEKFKKKAQEQAKKVEQKIERAVQDTLDVACEHIREFEEAM